MTVMRQRCEAVFLHQTTICSRHYQNHLVIKPLERNSAESLGSEFLIGIYQHAQREGLDRGIGGRILFALRRRRLAIFRRDKHEIQA